MPTVALRIEHDGLDENISHQKQLLALSGCVSIGRAVAFNTRGSLFESSHWWNFMDLVIINCNGRMKIKKKRLGMAHVKKTFVTLTLSLSLSHTHTLNHSLSEWLLTSYYYSSVLWRLVFWRFYPKKPFPILFQTMRSLTLTFTNNISRGQTQ